ncbi:hypothetical protein F4804DRAFT_73173 [Jackrogersella minutella]|nr:hypothetical protein F4804DRAFT_73173 [Jackrogersella minutella]
MDTDIAEKAEKVRKQGNELYRNKKFSEATKAYEEAANLATSDHTPLSNLSIVYFEVGKYSHCVHFARKALSFLDANNPETSIARTKLLARQAKAYVHLSRLGEAEKLLDQLDPSKETDELRDLIQAMRAFGISSQQPALLREMILQLPRLKPAIQDEPDYFGVGDDDAESLYTTEIEKLAGKDPVLSFMFCGIGDARHLFQTLSQYCSRKKGIQKLHITMLDIKPVVIARDLIFFYMLHEAVTSEESKDMVLLSLSYLFCAQIIPPFAWEKLQETINTLVDKLEKKQQPLSFAYLSISHMHRVLRALKSWQKGPAAEYETSRIRGILPKEIADMIPLGLLGDGHHYPKCELDHLDFKDFSVMFPPKAVLSRVEPELFSLMEDYRVEMRGAEKSVGNYLDRHWKVNPTLIDADWQARRPPWEEPNFGTDPSQIVEALTDQSFKLNVPKKSDYCILKHAADYFERVGQSILSLQGRLTIEMMVDDMANVLERIRYGFIDRPKQRQNEGDRVSSSTTDWPQKYHIIHLSNIPDYVGGSLASFFYASPVLKQGTGSGLMSCVLRNPNLWKGIYQFNAEWLLMYDRAMIQKHFSVKLAYNPGIISSMMPFSMMTDYHRWERCKRGDCSLEQLMSRVTLSRWLIAHFLKICLPFRRSEDEYTFVFAPLNTTAFMRLVVQMAESGYPGHWLSQIITSIGGGEITTTVRFPRQYIADPISVDTVYPPRTICVKPWTPEFTTLVTQWQGLFPFATVVPSGILPSPDIIIEYSIMIPLTHAGYANQPDFMLVFWNHRKYGEPPNDLYQLLFDDETGDMSASTRNIRTDGIKILYTFKWVADGFMASFWLRSDVVDLMVKEDWKVYIWRTDSWVRFSTGLPLKNNIFKKRTWKECVCSA